ncbi:DNA cytosine methyltransferase [Hymenobacter wooponensis]|nr:DNA cytosine methyltransferase [Hymenobacter wooponensis]
MDLFAGIGGFSLAAHWMGWATAVFCEWEEFPRQVLIKNFQCVPAEDLSAAELTTIIDAWKAWKPGQPQPTSVLYGDICHFTASAWRRAIDLVCGGFPCQDASHARTHSSGGNHTEQGLSGKRTGLWWENHRIIQQLQPRFAVGENVSAIRGKGLNIILQSLAEIGYDAEWCDMPAHWFGAPHPRERTWIVAYPNGLGRGEESLILSQIISRPIPQASQWEPSRAICSTYGKKALPEAYGIPDGIPRKLGKRGVDPEIKAHGNAIVPQVAYQLFLAIADWIAQYAP